MNDGTRETILIIDDNPTNCELLRAVLEKRGYRTQIAGGGREGLAMASSDPPELILLDIAMPDMDGYETCRHFKANDRTAEIPVIFISALDDTTDKVRAFETGGVDYISKPFKSAELIARIENQLKLLRLQRRLGQQNRELTKKNEEILQMNKEILKMAEDLQRAHSTVLSVFSSLSYALPGHVLDGKYRIDELIGTGGHGSVFRGMHLILNRPVAIKVLKPDTTLTDPDLNRVRAEGITTCSVNHPNAVEVWDAGVTQEGIAYLVMELLVGRTLRNELEEKKVLDVERSAEIAIAVCEVLSVAHAAGIVHRDIKPDNIFLHQSPEGEIIKVVDFGIAKLMNTEAGRTGAGNQTVTMVGTPEYIAPERFVDLPYDGRSDVYSLGIVLYEMLSGHVPFKASREFPWTIASSHLGEKPLPLNEQCKDLPPQIHELLFQALAKNPKDRPGAEELAQGIIDAMAGRIEPGRLVGRARRERTSAP